MSEFDFDTEDQQPVNKGPKPPMAYRFRGFLPVVIDVETGGFNSATDALLEIAATIIEMDEEGMIYAGETHFFRVEPFAGANVEPAALEFTGIKLDHPLRMAVTEEHALTEIFKHVRKAVKSAGCNRAVLVGHNAFFDLGFLNAAVERTRSSVIRFTPFPASTPPPWVVWHSARQSWPRPAPPPISSLTDARRTRLGMTPKRPPSSSAASSTAGARWAAGHPNKSQLNTSIRINHLPLGQLTAIFGWVRYSPLHFIYQPGCSSTRIGLMTA